MKSRIAGRTPGKGPANLLATVSNFYILVAVTLTLTSAIHFGYVRPESGVAVFNNPLKPSYFYVFTYAVSILVLLIGGLPALDKVGKGFALFFIGYGALHLAWLPFLSENDDVVGRGLTLRMNDVLMSLCYLIIFCRMTDLRRIIISTRAVMWATSALNVLVVLAPQLFPIRMGAFPGRAAGLYWDPNQCATFLAMSLPLICLNTRMPMRLLNYAVVLVGISFTFSREGWVMWVAAVALDLVLKPGAQKRDVGRIATNMAVLIGVSILFLLLLTALYEPIIESLRPFLTTDTYARLSGGDLGSGAERLLILRMGFDVFVSSPFVGSGLNATRTWNYAVSVHNMFILMLAEFGIIGGLLYAYFLRNLFTIKSNLGPILFTLVFMLSFFSHSLFDLSYYSLLFLLYWRAGEMCDGLTEAQPVRPNRARRAETLAPRLAPSHTA